jgi:hypothetical protein
MKLLSVISFLLFLSCSVVGQRISKTLIIDTLEGETSEFRCFVHTPPPSILEDDSKKFVQEKINLNKFPNLIAKIVIDSQVSVLIIPIDDSEGLLTINNIFQFKQDTIRVNRVNIYHNCLPDTIKSSLGWYRVHRNAVDSNQRFKQVSFKRYPDRVINKDCKISYPDSVSFSICNRIYKVQLQKTNHSVGVAWYHGNKKMSHRKDRKYEKRRSDGKPYTYFAKSVEKYKTILEAEVFLE